jgi:hypothetical protein
LVGGSLASSLYGMPRSTNDVDIVAELELRHVGPFVAALETDFVVDPESIMEAIQAQRSFNVIHMTLLDKVDIFIRRDAAWAREEMRRRQFHPITTAASGLLVAFASPEDTILSKLVWYRRGGEVSDRQWGDILAVLRVQHTRLDLGYLRKWADRLDVVDLLERAQREANIDNRET